jgi:hypothetical protein
VAKYEQTVIDQMQDELVGLISAWADRGIAPSDAALMLAGTSHMLLVKLNDLTFGEFTQIAMEGWKKNGGRF